MTEIARASLQVVPAFGISPEYCFDLLLLHLPSFAKSIGQGHYPSPSPLQNAIDSFFGASNLVHSVTGQLNRHLQGSCNVSLFLQRRRRRVVTWPHKLVKNAGRHPLADQ
jgi:hypothetical protein